MVAAVSPLEKHLGYWMRAVSNRVSHAFAHRLAQHDIAVAEWVVLRELLRLGAPAPSTLAESVGLTRGAISKIVDRLAARGLVERVPRADDRRYQSLTLTRAGRALVPRLARLADENDEAFFGHLTMSQRRTLMALLQDLAGRHRIETPPLD